MFRTRKTFFLAACFIVILSLARLGVAPAGVTQADGESRVYLPQIYGLKITFTPTFSPTLTFSPTPTSSPTPTKTPTLLTNGKPPMSGSSTFPGLTTSFYMTSIDGAKYYNMGCLIGTHDLNLPGAQDRLTILDFGTPVYKDSHYGASLMGHGPVTNDQILSASVQFAWGYYVCTGDDSTSHLRIGIGTNNYPGDFGSVTFEHGAAWGTMINEMNAWLVEQGAFSQVDFVGANDIELSWNDFTPTKKWLDGYNSTSRYDMYNFGAIPGCPYFASPGAQCGSYPHLWSKEEVWYVIYGAPQVYSLPEIYLTNGLNAQQWYLMSAYAYQAHGFPVGFVGSLTTYGACKQVGGCSGSGWGIDTNPQDGWNQLYTLLNKDPHTAQPLHWTTDMCWTNTGDTNPDKCAVYYAQIPTPTPQPTLSQLSTGDQSSDFVMQQLQYELGQVGISEQDRAILQAKLDSLIRVEQQRQQSLRKPSSKNSILKFTPSAPEYAFSLARREEIIEGSEGLVHTEVADIQNIWRGMVGEHWLQVLAGALPGSQQGLVMVFETGPGDLAGGPRTYLAPGMTGALKVASREGFNLRLIDPSGGILFFNLQTRSFHP